MSLRQRVGRLVKGRAPAAGRPATTIESLLGPHEVAMVQRCRPYTLASAERLEATADAVAYAVDRDIEGALVECGVWRGGSVLAMVLTLQRLGIDDRDVYLFDTFEGMTEPTAEDTSAFDPPALDTFKAAAHEGKRAWDGLFGESVFGLDGVRQLLLGTGYPPERFHFVVGKVEDTIPRQAPDHIAVLRLDTDWYESTRHEMTHLYPRVTRGGVLIVDDYGHWEGARRAVEEHFAATGEPLLLARTDYTGRMGVKL
jgi:hypothetical protein